MGDTTKNNQAQNANSNAVNNAAQAQNTNHLFAQQPYVLQNNGQNPYYTQAAVQQNGSYGQNPYYNQAQVQAQGQAVPHSHTVASWLGQTSSDRFIRGLVIGAAATYLLTNEKAQKAIIKTGMKLYGAVAGGVEEIKEKIMDAKAELEDCNDSEE